jgi:hypothetical protein
MFLCPSKMQFYDVPVRERVGVVDLLAALTDAFDDQGVSPLRAKAPRR